MGFRSIQDIRAWQVARKFKCDVYDLTDSGSLLGDHHLRDQLRDAAAAAPSHVSEGFGRFDPADFARFVKMAISSIVECRNHLVDAADRKHIAEEVRRTLDRSAEEVLKELGGLLAYLQSPEAKQNADRIRDQRQRRRRDRGTNSER